MEQQPTQHGSAAISRRGFLKAAMAVGGAAVASMVIAACGAQPTPAPANTPSAPAANTPAGTAPTSAPAVTKPKSGGKITWAIEQDPVNLIPFGAISTSNQWGKEFMYDSLVEWDKDLLVKPALAESWETPDAKTWIWHLRKGVKFHDGAEMTADDVKYSIDLQANPPPAGHQDCAVSRASSRPKWWTSTPSSSTCKAPTRPCWATSRGRAIAPSSPRARTTK